MVNKNNSAESVARFPRHLVIYVCLINLFVYGIIGLLLYQSRIKYEKQASLSTQNIATALNSFIDGQLDSYDIAIHSVKYKVEEALQHGTFGKEALESYIALQKSLLPQLQAIRMTDANGNVVVGAGDQPSGVMVNVADRDFFRYHRDNPNGDLFFQKPIFGRIAKQWVFNMVRRINNPDGSFAGTAYAVISIDRLHRIFSGIDVGKHGVITLRAANGAVIARYPTPPDLASVIGNKAVPGELQEAINSGKKVVSFNARSRIDGIQRIYNCQKVDTYPMYIVVGLAEDEYFADWHNEIMTYSFLAAVFTLVTVYFSIINYRRWRREKEIESELRKSRDELELRVQERTAEINQTNEQLNVELNDRKVAEQHLLESTNTISQLLQATDHGIYGIDEEGLCTFINNSALNNLGYRLEECVGKNLHPIIHHSHTDGRPYAVEECPIFRAKATGVGCRLGDEVLWRKDGTSFPVEYSSYPILDNGKISGAVVTFTDITARMRAEEEKAQLEIQLQHAQKMESVGRLAGGVAHDFNNMLSVILGHAELGLTRLDPAHPVSADLAEISVAAQRSAELTRQLLAFARRQPVAPKMLDLNETVEGMLKMMRRLIGEEVRLNWKPAPDLWPVMMDPSQIDQILANLCVNARDAIVGSGIISIETENVAMDESHNVAPPGTAPAEFVRMTITDNGSGMAKETLANIFEPFFTTKEQGKGTGLGLAMVYGIVTQNNGFIDVYSEPGRGTTFSIYLPHFDEEAPEKPGESKEEGPLPGGKETILLVEDEPAILETVASMLKKLGYKVLPAITPADAIRLAREHAGEIPLLLTDVVMPLMNGKDLAEALLASYPSLKPIFMSGYTADIIAHHGVLDKGAHFIQKPIALPILAAKVREVLDA